MNCLLGFTVHGLINESDIGLILTFYETIKVTHYRQRGTSLLTSCANLAVEKQKDRFEDSGYIWLLTQKFINAFCKRHGELVFKYLRGNKLFIFNIDNDTGFNKHRWHFCIS